MKLNRVIKHLRNENRFDFKWMLFSNIPGQINKYTFFIWYRNVIYIMVSRSFDIITFKNLLYKHFTKHIRNPLSIGKISPLKIFTIKWLKEIFRSLHVILSIEFQKLGNNKFNIYHLSFIWMKRAGALSISQKIFRFLTISWK